MPRYLRRSLQIVIDLAVLSVAYWLGFLIRFEFAIPPSWLPIATLGWPFVVSVELAVLISLGIPRFSWRYISLRETARIASALVLASTVLLVIRIAFGATLPWVVIPLGVLSSNLCLGVLLLVGIRAARRIYGEAIERGHRTTDQQLNDVLLIGAGQAGLLVSRELASRPDLGLTAVGFLDDDPRKLGTTINGLAVLGTTAQLADIAARKRVNRVLITIANAPGSEIRRITMLCRAAGLDTKIIPGIYEIVGDRVNLSRIREVAIEDLLGRAPVELDVAQVGGAIENRVVMVTGAGGSIGSELCRQLCRFSPSRLVLVERFENALFEIHRELIHTYPTVAIEPRIADVTDGARMEQLFHHSRPAIVFHAAAHKHVPMMEENPGEAVKNNVGGTRTVADLADRFATERFVLVSTDKAVNPSSVMGSTKRFAEIYTQALGQRSKTRFVTVRFGNVLGSNGSVIPIFKQQIARGGPVTITHADMRRYFMTIPEASQLVVQAGSMGQGGEIFILDMGEPVRIIDLARDLIRLSGFEPDKDIAIDVTGVRPGEKLFEELSTDAEHAEKTEHAKIFIGRIQPTSWSDVARSLDELLRVAAGSNHADIAAALKVAIAAEAPPTTRRPTHSEPEHVAATG